jgi:hypothetical protein
MKNGNGGNMPPPIGAMALTRRIMRCSNADCEYHAKDAIFEQKTLVQIVYDVLRPGEFAPVVVGMRNLCRGCGWIFAIEAGNPKPMTLPPEEDPDFGTQDKG